MSGALTKTQHQLEEARQKEESAIGLEHDIRSQFNKLNALYDEAQARYVEANIPNIVLSRLQSIIMI